MIARAAALSARGARVESLPADAERLALPAVLERLAELEVNEVLVEAGATLAGELLRQGLVDELLLYVAPQLLGPTARSLVTLPDPAALERGADLRIHRDAAAGRGSAAAAAAAAGVSAARGSLQSACSRGIVQDVGRVQSREQRGGDVRLVIAVQRLDLSRIRAGDSICVQGCCLTATEVQRGAFAADVSRETLVAHHAR